MIQRFNAQFVHPEGQLGRLVGLILALKNRQRNAWTISLLDIQPNDHVLEKSKLDNDYFILRLNLM